MNKEHFSEGYFIDAHDGEMFCRQHLTTDTEQILIQPLNNSEEKELKYLLLESTHTFPTKLLTVSLLSMYYNRGYLVEKDDVSRLLFENKQFYRWILQFDPELEIMRKWKSRFLSLFPPEEASAGEIEREGYTYFLS